MKLKTTLALLAASGLLLAACNNNASQEDKTDTAAVTVETPPEALPTAPPESKTTVIEVKEVPAPVTKTFTDKNPKAREVEWMTFEPVEYDYLPEPKYYYVRYDVEGVDYYSWYNEKGDWIRTSTRFTGGSSKLPEAVNKMLAAQYPDYAIDEIDKENDKDMEMYELELHKGESKVKLKVLPDGTIVKKK